MATPSNANKLTPDDIALLVATIDLGIQSAQRMQNTKNAIPEVVKGYEARETKLQTLRIKLQQASLEL